VNRKTIVELLKDTFRAWSADNAPLLAAAISFYTIFSLAPLLILAIAVTRFIYGDEARMRVTAQASRYAGSAVGDALGVLISNAGETTSGIVATVAAAIALLLGASGVFAQLMGALDRIWHVQPSGERGPLGIITDRFLGFLMLLIIGALFLLTLVVSAVIAQANAVASIFAPSWLDFAPILNIIGSLILTTLLFAAVYKVLPRVTLTWRDVWIGAVATAGLFVVGKELISLYLTVANPASGYDTAGSLIVLLIFVYYSSQIFLIGAEFTKIYARRFGSHVRLESGAVRYRIVTESEAEPVMRAVAGTVPAEDVQLMARPLEGQSDDAPPFQPDVQQTSAPDPSADGRPGIMPWLLGTAVAFVAGVLVGGRDRTGRNDQTDRRSSRW
jgi:membrane protein